jgi:hypothetical protein
MSGSQAALWMTINEDGSCRINVLADPGSDAEKYMHTLTAMWVQVASGGKGADKAEAMGGDDASAALAKFLTRNSRNKDTNRA